MTNPINPLVGPLDNPATAPHLLDLLWAEYCQQMGRAVAKDAAAGVHKDVKEKWSDSVVRNMIFGKVRAVDFIAWAKRYLDKFPPTETFYVENGQGLRLANQKMVTVGGAPLPDGAMAPGGQGSVAITPGGRGDSIENGAVGI
jgi:hypothetical protein